MLLLGCIFQPVCIDSSRIHINLHSIGIETMDLFLLIFLFGGRGGRGDLQYETQPLNLLAMHAKFRNSPQIMK